MKFSLTKTWKITKFVMIQAKTLPAQIHFTLTLVSKTTSVTGKNQQHLKYVDKKN